MHEKPATTKYPLHDLLRRRWSSRALSSRPVENEKIGSLVEAVRWSASARNEQPWRLIIVEKSNTERHQAVINAQLDVNLPWATATPLFIIIVCANKFPDGSLNDYAQYDCGAAATSLSLQALDLGLHCRQLGALNREKLRAAFNIPADHEPLIVAAIGYEGTDAQLSPKQQDQETAPRQRKPISEFTYQNTWSEPANL